VTHYAQTAMINDVLLNREVGIIGADTGGMGGSIPHFYSSIFSFAVSGWIITPLQSKKFLGSLRSP
jgi:hypothetical protein